MWRSKGQIPIWVPPFDKNHTCIVTVERPTSHLMFVHAFSWSLQDCFFGCPMGWSYKVYIENASCQTSKLLSVGTQPPVKEQEEPTTTKETVTEKETSSPVINHVRVREEVAATFPQPSAPRAQPSAKKTTSTQLDSTRRTRSNNTSTRRRTHTDTTSTTTTATQKKVRRRKRRVVFTQQLSSTEEEEESGSEKYVFCDVVKYLYCYFFCCCCVCLPWQHWTWRPSCCL